MTPQNLFHYLNGAIELNNLDHLDSNNFNRIQSILKHMSFDNSAEGQFCLWLQGVMDLADDNQLSHRQFSKVIEKINNCSESQIPSHLSKLSDLPMVRC